MATQSETARGLGISRQRLEQLRHPERSAARARVHAAIKSGLLPKAKSLFCIDCGSPASDYDHHLGYAVEMWLSVVPRCKGCHGKRPREFEPQSCVFCLKLFTPNGAGHTKFCSDTCRAGQAKAVRLAHYKDAECAGCGAEITRHSRFVEMFDHLWCGKKCMGRTKQSERNLLERWNGSVLRNRRVAAGLSQSALGKLIGVTQGYISHMESGIDPPNEELWGTLFTSIGLTSDEITSSTYAEPLARDRKVEAVA